jgi:hypothetical protein
MQISKEVVKWLTFVHRFREVPGLNLGLETGYPEAFRGSPQSLLANIGIVPSN